MKHQPQRAPRLEPALAHDYPRVLGVAHNAGNNLGTLTRALLYLHSRLPEVTMLFSVAGPDAVHQLQSTPALQGPLAVSQFSRAWWTRTWSPGCTNMGC